MFTHSPKIVTDGLVLCLDAGSPKSYGGSGTTWTDISRNGNNGTLVNGPTYSAANGGSIVFDGTNDYVEVPHSSVLSGNVTNRITVECWAYAIGDGILSTREIFHKRNNDTTTFVSYGVSWQSADSGVTNKVFSRLGFTDNTVSDLFSSNIPKNIWFHIIQTFNGTDHNLYINGILNTQATSLSGKTIKDTSAPVTIGSYTGSSEFFNGRVSSCRFYNRALSQSEILQNYNATKSRFGL